MKIENNLVLGDCLEILPEIPNEIFDLIIIDFPYNLKKFINISKDEFYILMSKWNELIIPKLKESGSFYAFMGHDYFDTFKKIFCQNLNFKRELIWHYNDYGIRFDKRNYLSEFEKIFFYVKSEDYIFNEVRKKPSKSTIRKNKHDKNGFIDWNNLSPYHRKKYKTKKNYENKGKWNVFKGKQMGNVFIFPRVSRGNNPEIRFGRHPTQKPERLIEILIKVSSNEGDLIGDFFAGSGTTLVVAKKLRRNYFGIEIESKYYEIAKERLNSVNVFENLLNF